MTPEWFRRCFGKVPEAMLLVSADGMLLAANEAARQFLQLDPKLHGVALRDLVGDAPEKVAQLLNLWGRSRDLTPGALSFKCGDGGSTACRIEGGVFESAPDQKSLLLRVFRKDDATRRFRALTERIDALHHEIIERKRTEAKLHAQQEWLSTTLSSIGDAVIATDTQGAVSFLNGVAQSLTGWTQEQAHGRPLEEIFVIRNEHSGLLVENPVSQALREGKIVGLANHTILTARDGRRIPIDDSAAPITDMDGKISGVVLVFRDVTERKKSEEALQRSIAFAQAVMTNMGEGLYTVDAQGVVTFMNPAAEKLFGWSFEELRGRKMHDVTHHHHADGTPFPAEECSGLKVLKEGTYLTDHEDVFIRKDGTFFDVIYSSSPLRSGTEILGLVVVFRDVSERKRLEKALRNSEQMYRAIGESINYGVWVCDPAGRNVYASESFLQLVGLTQKQCSDFGWREVLHPDDADRTIAGWKECVATEGAWNIEHRFRGVDGNYHWVLARGVPVHDERGQIAGWAGINLDIDQLKAVEETLRANERDLRATNQALLRANADLEQFAYSASHDLQEPIRNVAIYSEIIATRYGGNLDEVGRQFLGFLHEGGRRLARLINDLLAYTSAGRVDDRFQQADAGEAYRQALLNLEQPIQESGAVITCDPLPPVYMMEVHLQQLFQNLIGNAIKYRSQEPPRIHVAAIESEGMWRFSVHDNGIGIDPQYKEKIFGVFKRLQHDSTHTGTGIGLAICQRVIERYGGRIWVESEPGQGATFFFTVGKQPTIEHASSKSTAGGG